MISLSRIRSEAELWMGQRFLVFSILLGALGVWLLLPSVLIGGAPVSANRAAQLSQSGSGPFRALAAARVGLIRGDLWGLAAQVLDDSARISAPDGAPQDVQEAKQNLPSACRHALKLAPVSSRLWTVCAASCGSGLSDECVSNYIQMSYLTGPYVVDSIPSRLRAAMQVDLTKNPELKFLVDGDVSFILRQQTALKPDLASSYRGALAINKPALLSEINGIDPAFAGTLQ